MVDKSHKLELKLDPNRLLFIVESAVMATTEIVNFHFNALSKADLSTAAMRPETIVKFPKLKLSAEQRRAMHENWILAKAIHELLRAVRNSLEEAHVFVKLLNKEHKIGSNATLAEFLGPFRSKAAGLEFPKLLEAVNQELDPKLNFTGSYKSLQKARNCLEHRNGVISKKETHGSDKFDLTFPRIKLFYLREGEEVEVTKGCTISPGDDRESVEVFMKLDVRQRSFAVGERLTFTSEEFNEIAFACYFLGQQLSTRLPRPTTVGE